MIFKTLLHIGLVSGFAWAGAAYAQDNDWQSALGAAVSSADSPEKVETLTALTDSAKTPREKTAALFYLGQSHFEAGRYGSAIPPFQAALTLSRDTSPDNIRQHDTIYDQLTASLLKANRYDEAMALGEEYIAKNDERLIDIWAKTDTAMSHRRTALQCPHHIAGMLRTGTTNYRPDGTDVGCSYKDNSDKNGVLTLYFTAYGEGFDSDEKAHGDAAAPMARTATKNGGVLISDYARSDIQSPDGSTVFETVYKDNRGYTGAWTSIYDGWVLKTRVTWQESLGAEYGSNQTNAVFLETMRSVNAHMMGCSAIKDIDDAPATNRSPLEIMLQESLTDHKQTAFKRPPSECTLLTSENGNAFLSEHTSGKRLYTVAGKAISGDVFVSEANDTAALLSPNAGNEYLLKHVQSASETSADSLSIIKGYSRKPSAEQVFTDFAEYNNGETKAYGRIEFDEDGGTNIIVDPSK